MNELFVQTTDEVAYDFIEFAKTNHHGIEIFSKVFLTLNPIS
jgi:hypothetical protein